MKNIQVLPTDKEPVKGDLLLRHLWKGTSNECISWWRYNDTIVIDDVLQYTTLNGSFRDITSSFKVQNIYIISDEEIKKGDWVFDLDVKRIVKADNLKVAISKKSQCWYYKKIILTTDQDLIKDGVQAIDDEFLEWFVQNPTCEWFDVKYQYWEGRYTYQIIIPKEEVISDYDVMPNIVYGENVGERIKIKAKIISKEEPKQETLEEQCACTDECLGYLTQTCKRIEESNKQETLEEVAEKYANDWEEIHPKLNFEAMTPIAISKIDFIEGAKWQQERMYSEEEVIYLLYSFKNYLGFGEEVEEKKWFEQFKKK